MNYAIAVPKSGRGITTNGRSNSVTIFDLKTLKPIVELPTGKIRMHCYTMNFQARFYFQSVM
ncbi:MAG: hypothetical protein IPJ20_25800 [Flammeovirgaceae bacterium]|nr:hypothetical protein [Flammeovirgaceae bacterium]